MARARRLRWFTLDASDDEPWTVYLVDSITEDGEDCLGLTRYVEREILVAAWQPFEELCYTTIHELLHAWSGEDPDDEVARLAEERFIRRAEAAAFHGLVQMGLRLPDLPRGFDAMRARAIAAREAR
jgi:hypothetical protein